VRRRATTAAGLVPVVGLSLLLTACSGQSGQALAQQACRHVDLSLRLYRAAERTPSPAVARTKVQQAYVQLRAALPLAAAATSDDGQWNALMTAISESARVSEAQLLTALQDECAVANGTQQAVPLAPSGSGSSGGGSSGGSPPATPSPTRPQNGY
jgi:hypothetical protein